MAALGQPGWRLRVDEGVEVGRIEEEGLQVEAIAINQAAAEILFEAVEGLGIEVVEVVPEALAGEVAGWHGQQAREDGPSIPTGQAGFGEGAQGAIEGGEQDVVGDGMALETFAGMVLDQAGEVQVLCDLPECRDGGGVTDGGLEWLGALLEACQQIIGLAQVGQDDGARLAVDPAGFDELPVGMTADGLFLEAGHKVSVYNSDGESQMGPAILGKNPGKTRENERDLARGNPL